MHGNMLFSTHYILVFIVGFLVYSVNEFEVSLTEDGSTYSLLHS